jgi:hypothetical protein
VAAQAIIKGLQPHLKPDHTDLLTFVKKDMIKPLQPYL